MQKNEPKEGEGVKQKGLTEQIIKKNTLDKTNPRNRQFDVVSVTERALDNESYMPGASTIGLIDKK